MKFVSATLLAVSFLLALIFGAQTAEWSWGPALVALALAVGASTFVTGESGGRWLGISMLPAAGWIFYRAFGSDVADFARADSILVLVVLAGALVVGRLRPGARSLPVLFAGLAVVSIANLIVGVVQSQNPEFMWPYHHRPSDQVTGFFGHYNYFSNYTAGVGLLLAARGLFARDHVALRFLFMVTAVWSGAMVAVSGSRGGTVAMGIGVVILVACGAVLAWRRKSAWAKTYLVAFPLLLIGAVVVGWVLLSKVQERRGPNQNLMQMADNSARLEWVGLALKVAGDHPLTGGGSRAYSWERNRHWDPGDFGKGDENERFVHNELLQTFTDYGAVGAVLVLIPIGCVGWLGLSRLFIGGDRDDEHLDAVAAGVLAAGGMVVAQANFSFVFHLLPSTLLLGLLLGLGALLTGSGGKGASGKPVGAIACGLLALALFGLGINGTRTLRVTWPVLYAETSLVHARPEAAVERLEQAAAIWKGHRMLEEAANFSRVAAASAATVGERDQWNLRAAENYRKAIPMHPHHPGLVLNLANTLSDLGRVEEAEEAYQRAIALQGGLEGAFQARYFYAKNLYELWYRRWTDPERREAARAMWYFQRAIDLLDEADTQAGWGKSAERRKELRVQIEEALVFLREARIRPDPPNAISE